MSSPFPGMDPYLEDPDIWVGFHHSFADETKAHRFSMLRGSSIRGLSFKSFKSLTQT